MRLKTLGFVGGLALAASANAADVRIDSYGYAGVLYNQGFTSTSTIGLSARAGANFYFDNGLSLGLGAVGAWGAWDKNGSWKDGTSSQYPDHGDVSDAFIKYVGNDWQIAFGRFDSKFLGYDWLSDSIQGAGLAFNNLHKGGVVNRMDLWVTYFNSALITGAMPNRIASELSNMTAYHPTGRSIIGSRAGNVVAAGLNMNVAGFVLDPYVLFNNSAALNNIPTDNILLQAGAKFGYIVDFTPEWRSSTLVRGMFQLAPQKGSQSKDAGFLGWIDQEFAWNKQIEFGAGFYFVGGQQIWHLSDNSRFYGKMVAPQGRGYFEEDTWSAYLFGSFDLINDKLGIDVMLAYGEYIEGSIMAKYAIWKGERMRTDIGGGYVYAKSGGTAINNAGNLLVFGKLSY